MVAQLGKEKQLLHEYLHALFLKDPQAGKKYHEMQVSLYAEFDVKMLLNFLKNSSDYKLDEALKICENKKLYPEIVFILGKMGNTKQGLQLLIEKIGDVKAVSQKRILLYFCLITLSFISKKKAIEFVESHNDDDLWEDLINHSIHDPQFISKLL